jgi:hypothetical protein
MPRKTGLAIVSERAATDQELQLRAAIDLDHAEREEQHQIAPPEDIIAELRRQLIETGRVADSAITQMQTEAARANAAEARVQTTAETAETEKAKIQDAAAKQIVDARTKAAQAIAEAQRQHQVAEKTAAAAQALQRAAGFAGTILAFIADRAPSLLTLLGAYLLARDILAAPTPTQLGLLALYGAVAVVPAVWLSIRRG